VGEERFSLSIQPGSFAICQLAPGAGLPAWALEGPFCSVTRTPDELSIVCAESAVPAEAVADRGWRLLSVRGRMDLTLVGVLAGLSGTLARAGVSVFALSTYDTDHLLVRAGDLDAATRALAGAGYGVEGCGSPQ